MGHKNKESLVKQVTQEFQAQLQAGAGRSKHADKQAGDTVGRVYSFSTCKTYIKHACAFVKWAKAEHGCRTLADCRPYASDWIRRIQSEGKSAWTLKLKASAVAKMYRCTTADLGIETPARRRADIVRSRQDVVRDKHFSNSRNADLLMFARCTGLRRRELQQVTGRALCLRDGRLCLDVQDGTKGGRRRIAPIMGSQAEIQAVAEMCRQADKNAVWGRTGVPGAMDVHACRRQYASRVYADNARPLETLSRSQKYYCRGDKKGAVYDRRALMRTSQALGHGRTNVVASNYL